MRIYMVRSAARSSALSSGCARGAGRRGAPRYNRAPFSYPPSASMPFAFVFPGQGSQSVGMLAQLAGAEPLVQQTFAEASDVLGYDLWELCQGGPEEELGKTERTQPAMLAAGVATWRVWRKHGGGLPAAMSGPSRRADSARGVSGQA